MTDYTACMFGASPGAFAALLERNTHTMSHLSIVPAPTPAPRAAEDAQPSLYVATYVEYFQSQASAQIVGVFTDQDTAQREADKFRAVAISEGAYEWDTHAEVTPVTLDVPRY